MKSLFIATLGALLVCTINLPAQSTTNSDVPPPPPGGPGEHHHDRLGFLSDAEKAELKKAHDAAVAANPDLDKQMKDLHEQMKAAHESGQAPDPSLRDKAKSLRDQMDAAMVKADPDVAPILAKMKEHHHEGGPEGGAPPPPANPGT